MLRVSRRTTSTAPLGISTSPLTCMAVSMKASAARDCSRSRCQMIADLALEVGVQPADRNLGIGDRSLDGEQRHDGHAEPDGDEALGREVVVAAEHDVGLGADPFEGAGDADARMRRRRHRDHPHARQLGEVDGVVLRQRVIGCGDQHLRIADQLDHGVRIVE